MQMGVNRSLPVAVNTEIIYDILFIRSGNEDFGIIPQDASQFDSRLVEVFQVLVNVIGGSAIKRIILERQLVQISDYIASLIPVIIPISYSLKVFERKIERANKNVFFEAFL